MTMLGSDEKLHSEQRSEFHSEHIYEEEAFSHSKLALSEKSAVQSLCLRAIQWAFRKGHQNLFEGAGKRAVDVGCAYGYVTSLLDQFKYDSVGLDISKYALKTGEKVDRMRANAEDLPFRSGTIGVITCFDTFEHLSRPTLLLKESHRCLRQGGVLIIENPVANPIDIISDKLHKMGKIHCSLLPLGEFLSSVRKAGFQTTKRGLLPIPFQRFPVFGRFIELPVPASVARRILILAIKS